MNFTQKAHIYRKKHIYREYVLNANIEMYMGYGRDITEQNLL